MTSVKRSNRPGGQAGFTIIELAIVLIISGMIMVGLVEALLYKMREERRTQTMTALADTQAALTEFVGNNQRYPCPADPTLGPNDPNYGYEMVDANHNCTAPSIPPAFIRGNDPEKTDPTHMDTVFFGALPFNTIMPSVVSATFTAADTLDGWNNKLGYAVTGSLANRNTYKDTNGGIDVRDEHNISMLSPPSSAHIVVYSYGEDGFGANTQDGVAVGNCSAGGFTSHAPPSATLNEWQNCMHNSNVFLSGLRAVGSPNVYNDDYMRFLTTQSGSFWTITGPVTGLPLGAVVYKVTNTNSGNVGVGVDNPSEKLDVKGNLVVQSPSDLLAAGLCDQSGLGPNCFAPTLLGGSDPNMDCAAQGSSMVMTGVSQGKITCAKVVFPQAAYTCPPGHFITGISNLGNVHCN